MTLGNRIKKIRREFDLTQEVFAARIGSVQNTITGYESGRRNPSSPVISLICREFNVNEEWLRNGTGEMFLPDSGNELKCLVKKYNLTAADQVLIEKYIALKPEAREKILNFMSEVVSSMTESAGSYFDAPDTPEELERQYPPEDMTEEGAG